MIRKMLGAACALVLVLSAASHPASAALVTGAENFRLSMVSPIYGQVFMAWGPAGPQTFGWLVVRYSERAPQGERLEFPFLGNPIGLPSYANGTTDATPLVAGLTCYVLIPVDANINALGHSDVLCKMNGFSSGVLPAGFGITLEQSNTATVSWSYPSSGISGMAVVSSAGDIVLVPFPVNSVSVQITKGTCFRGYALWDTAVVGTTDVFCGEPGQFASVPQPNLMQLGTAATTLRR